MKRIPISAVYDLPLSELRTRADCARDALRAAQSRATSSVAPSGWHHRAGVNAIDEALAAVDRLIPGLMRPPDALLVRVIRALAPREREALRNAIDAERVARERLARMLGDIPPAHAEDVLARVEVEESIATELAALFRVIGRAYCASVMRA